MESVLYSKPKIRKYLCRISSLSFLCFLKGKNRGERRHKMARGLILFLPFIWGFSKMTEHLWNNKKEKTIKNLKNNIFFLHTFFTLTLNDRKSNYLSYVYFCPSIFFLSILIEGLNFLCCYFFSWLFVKWFLVFCFVFFIICHKRIERASEV